ncbi:cytochrome C oxidase subunit IV family protein [Aquabacterium sp.]|uniref:cytochrome C oxidase subunit IV family protein n=1 Tax=Aquabacterium sp. TaxID=1872578 RepID=UPI002BAED793|nr:cytochrome C oxidase subunit IV family protein [Aquabacterium sp.]HSW02949.1 cytochrome C oxidase subunit IV family protein [Aquabacterium sp.]
MTTMIAETTGTAGTTPQAGHQQHPIGLYLKIWALLFVLSTLSYLVDYFHFQGLLRWGLILVFMMLKAGLIVAVFMHLAWERLALIYAILVPPLALLVLVGLMLSEGGHTHLARVLFFR